jgi:hypothetical protein
MPSGGCHKRRRKHQDINRGINRNLKQTLCSNKLTAFASICTNHPRQNSRRSACPIYLSFFLFVILNVSMMLGGCLCAVIRATSYFAVCIIDALNCKAVAGIQNSTYRPRLYIKGANIWRSYAFDEGRWAWSRKYRHRARSLPLKLRLDWRP